MKRTVVALVLALVAAASFAAAEPSRVMPAVHAESALPAMDAKIAPREPHGTATGEPAAVLAPLSSKPIPMYAWGPWWFHIDIEPCPGFVFFLGCQKNPSRA